jgi:hypothetical protein
MNTDEREIFHFLQSWGADYINAAEICRRAGTKKKFHADPNWAKPILMVMAERGILESDPNGRYRIKPVPKKDKHNRWGAPDIAKILKEGGVEVEDSGGIASDEYYDQL